MKTARNRLGVVVATVALLALTACGNDATGTPDAKDETLAPTGASSPTTQPSGTPTKKPPEIPIDPKTGKWAFCEKQTGPTTGEAAKVFGRAEVKDAYCEMVDLTMSESFLKSMMIKQEGFRAIEFSVIRDYMTPDAKKAWDANVNEVVAGNHDSANDMWGLMFFAMKDPTYEFYPETSAEPAIMNLEISPAETGVDYSGDEPRLLLKFTTSVDLNMTDGKDPYFFPMKRTVSYYLLQNGANEKSWLIDGWETTYDWGKPHKRPKPALEDPSAEG